MAYRFSIVLPTAVKSHALVRGLYATVHVNAPGFGRDVHRTSLICQTSRFNGMTSFSSGVQEEERLDFIVDIEMLLYSHRLKDSLQGKVMPCLYSGFQLASPATREATVQTIDKWRKWWTGKVTTASGGTAAAPVSDLAVTEVCVGIHAYTPIQLVEGGNDHASVTIDARAVRSDARRMDQYETQIAEVSIPLWLLLEIAQMTDSKREATCDFGLPLLGNDSGAWSFLKDGSDARVMFSCRGRVGSVPCLVSPTSVWNTYSHKIRQYIQSDLIPAAAEWRALIARGFNDGYSSMFARDISGLESYKSREGIQRYWGEIRRLYLPRHKIAPYIPQIYSFHAMILELYSKPEFLGESLALAPLRWVRSEEERRNPAALYGASDRESITVPIWYYTLSRRPKITHDRSTRASHLSVFLRAFSNILKCYGMDCEGNRADAKRLRDGLMSIWSKKSYLLTETDRCDLVAANDIISLFFSSFGWMGKYHSDITADANPGERVRARGTESCDVTRLAGTSCSDDCEGCESCVRDAYVLCTSIFTRHDIVDEVNRYWPSDTIKSELARLLSCMIAYVHRHYDYYAVSGEVASAYPGLDKAVPLAPNAGGDPDSIQRMRTGLSGLKYASEQDSSSQPGFHQYAILLPVCLQYQMTTKSFASPNGFSSTLSRDGSSHQSIIESYVEQRARTSDAQSPRRSADGRTPQNSIDDAFVPPAIVLEGTYPTSTLFIGPSVFAFYSLQKRPYPTLAKDMTRYQQTIVAADTGASITTLRTKKELQRPLKSYNAQFFTHQPYKRTSGIFNADMTRMTILDSEPRFTSSWYRRICHGVNVTMLETLGMDKQLNAACAHVTFVNGQCGGFGVPIEDLQLLSLPSGHPDALTYPMHELAYSFTRTPTELFNRLDVLEAKLRLLDRLPPVNVFGDYSEVEGTGADIRLKGPMADQSTLAVCDGHFIAERVLKTRFCVVENDINGSPTLQLIRKTVTVMPGSIDSDGSPKSSIRMWRENFYPHFTTDRSFVSVIEC